MALNSAKGKLESHVDSRSGMAYRSLISRAGGVSPLIQLPARMPSQSGG